MGGFREGINSIIMIMKREKSDQMAEGNRQDSLSESKSMHNGWLF
jgi:hypothetical protein